MLVLPPLPHEPGVRVVAERRRELLTRSAFGQGWEIVDSADARDVLGALRGEDWDEGLAVRRLPVSVFDDEAKRLFAVAQPAGRLDGLACAGWNAADRRLFDLQDDGSALAWVSLPTVVGRHELPVFIGGATHAVALTCWRQDGFWPVTAIRDGVPVDRRGDPVVLVARRRRTGGERDWKVLKPDLPRPQGPPLVAGACGGRAWVPAMGDGVRTYAGEAGWRPDVVLVGGLTAAGERPPRSFCWAPGNAAIAGGAWNGEEERLLEVVTARFTAMRRMPRLLLLLPALPGDPALRAVATHRRNRLRTQAGAYDWEVVDLERLLADHPDCRGDDGEVIGVAAEKLGRVLARRLE
jgi:hypothetical protein